MQLSNVVKAPLSTLVGAGIGGAVLAAPTPQTGDHGIDIAITVLQVIAGIIPIIVGALRGPK